MVVGAIPTGSNVHVWQYVWPVFVLMAALCVIAVGARSMWFRRSDGRPLLAAALSVGGGVVAALLAGWLEWDRLERAARPLGLTVPALVLLVVLGGAYMADVGGVQSGRRS